MYEVILEVVKPSVWHNLWLALGAVGTIAVAVFAMWDRIKQELRCMWLKIGRCLPKIEIQGADNGPIKVIRLPSIELLITNNHTIDIGLDKIEVSFYRQKGREIHLFYPIGCPSVAKRLESKKVLFCYEKDRVCCLNPFPNDIRKIHIVLHTTVGKYKYKIKEPYAKKFVWELNQFMPTRRTLAQG